MPIYRRRRHRYQRTIQIQHIAMYRPFRQWPQQRDLIRFYRWEVHHCQIQVQSTPPPIQPPIH